MDRINRILIHPEYKQAMDKNFKAERKRIFCKHGIEHQLDVARIAYIMALEQGLPYSKELIYAASLLHDIGRYLEYEGKLSHEEGSVLLAKDILIDSGFSQEETGLILDGIKSHRTKDSDPKSFQGIIYMADKMSRNCFECNSRELCNWTEDKKNKGINI